ncbi:SPOR domain-containing protein [Erythrobacter sp. sf7]|uniref:SPOR domain-containing protein n=1 Tax=Erythrobacter fulvus TaxID=2987523 RepID=A0ABT5JMU7_9SPHN|nr:SPOR domain-containing protein [Erythrobacter fulvus]MDC8754081.1 SPOR domain-containing protein [Erythrobacter fulvus]
MIDAEYEELETGDGELDLADTDNLPWLESDEEDEDAGGLDLGQILGFVGVLIVLLAAIVGAVWYVSNRASGIEAVADGSVIEAPEGPIKERPEDPGGKTFAGTGNVAPVVGEGGTREAVVASKDAAPAPKPSPSASVTAAPAPAADMSGVGVQLAAYSSRARAEQGWSDLTRRTEVLSGVKHRVVEGKVDIGTVYRLQAIAANRTAAEELCAALKADGLDCQVK